MNTLTSDLSRVNINAGYVEINEAAQLLHRHLGKDIDHWLEFLREDLHNSRHEDEDHDLPWQNIEGVPHCSTPEFYSYIAQRNPKSLGLGTSDCLDEKSPYFEAYGVMAHVDYEHGGRLLVGFGPHSERHDYAYLTAREALALAQKLLNVAQYCETHDYHFGLCKTELKLAKGGATAPMKELSSQGIDMTNLPENVLLMSSAPKKDLH